MKSPSSWNDHYASGFIPWETGHASTELQRVVAERGIAPCRAIDLGCGTGSSAVWLASQGFDVTGVDISPFAIERARLRAAEAGVAVEFLVADLSEPPPELSGPFDFFFDRGCYHVVRRNALDGYLRCLERLSRPGSLGLFLAGNAKEPRSPGPPTVSEEEIRRELGALFEIVELREIRFDKSLADDVRFLGWSCFGRGLARPLPPSNLLSNPAGYPDE